MGGDRGCLDRRHPCAWGAAALAGGRQLTPPLRVLHIISTVAPRYGGPSAAVRGMATATAALGADVTVATTDADGPGRLSVAYDAAVRENGVSFRYFPRSAFSAGWHYSWPLTRWLWRSASQFDVIEVHGLFTYTTIPGCRFAIRAGVPYVVRPLGTLGGWSLAQSAWKKRPYYSLIERPHLARAAAIHATAESERAEIEALGFGPKVHVIPLGVDVEKLDVRRVRPEPARLRLLFLSRVHPKKGLELLFAALVMLAERGWRDRVSLTIAGDGESSYLRNLQTEALRLGIGNLVRFVGPVAGEDKRQAFAEADAFVLPSHNENFGIAAAEAMAAGIPVILSHDVGLARDAERSGAGISVARDATALAAAIERLGFDPTARRAMGDRAWQYARDNLSWAQCARRLTAMYEDVAGRASRATPTVTATSTLD